MKKLEHISRGRRYVSVEAVFESEMFRSVCYMMFKNEKGILLHSYMGKRTAKIKVEDVPLTVDMGLSIEVNIFDKEQEIKLVSVSERKGMLWARRSLMKFGSAPKLS